MFGYYTFHYNDVIMTKIASQITSLTVVYSTVYWEADQRKHQSSASLAFVWGIHRDRWIPRTKGQLRGKCFHLMTSSCYIATTSHRAQWVKCILWLSVFSCTIKVMIYRYLKIIAKTGGTVSIIHRLSNWWWQRYVNTNVMACYRDISSNLNGTID